MAWPLLTKGKIFDFDLTMTNGHTFEAYSLDMFFGADPSVMYEAGKNIGKKLLKTGVPFEHDAAHVSAIATHHNNPALLAGFVAHMLGKELQLVETITSEEPKVAVNVYQIVGVARPFLISYIPDQENDFEPKLLQLGDKNHQIKFLQQILQQQGQLTESAVIDFYDDTETNCLAARQIPEVNTHWVNKHNPHFSILKSHKSLVLTEFAELFFKEQLRIVKEKADDLQQWYPDSAAAVAANKLYIDLDRYTQAYFSGNMDGATCKTKCTLALGDAHKELDKHRGWKEVFANLAIAVGLLGVGYLAIGLYNVCKNRDFMFYKVKTDSANKLDYFTDHLASLSLP
jgi:hypothetical protein